MPGRLFPALAQWNQGGSNGAGGTGDQDGRHLSAQLSVGVQWTYAGPAVTDPGIVRLKRKRFDGSYRSLSRTSRCQSAVE